MPNNITADRANISKLRVYAGLGIGPSGGTAVWIINNLPTNPTGLASDELWNNNGVLSIVSP